MTKYEKGKFKTYSMACQFEIVMETCSLSYGEIAEYLSEIEKYARRYGMIKELKENGIL